MLFSIFAFLCHIDSFDYRCSCYCVRKTKKSKTYTLTSALSDKVACCRTNNASITVENIHITGLKWLWHHGTDAGICTERCRQDDVVHLRRRGDADRVRSHAGTCVGNATRITGWDVNVHMLYLWKHVSTADTSCCDVHVWHWHSDRGGKISAGNILTTASFTFDSMPQKKTSAGDVGNVYHCRFTCILFTDGKGGDL